MTLRNDVFGVPEPAAVASTAFAEDAALHALRVEGADAARSTATAYTMNVGDQFNGTLGTVGDADWVRVTLQPGIYVISLNGRGSSALSDSYLRVMDASGNVIAYNDDSGGTLNSQLTLNITTGGTYYLEAASYSDDYTGDYTLAIDEAPASTDVLTMDEIAEVLTDGFWESMGGSRRAFDVGQGDALNVDLSALTADGQRLASMALAAWEQVLGITFNRNPGANATVHITFDDNNSGAYSTSQVFGGDIISSHVNIGTDWLAAYGTGYNTYSYQTYIHEIGHALGLGHAGNYNGSATYGVDNDYANDSWQASIMSYFSQRDNTTVNASYAYIMSAMPADILAMQSLYGTGSIRTGSNTYGEQTNAGASYSTIASLLRDPATRNDIAFTIFDQGGFDTLDLRQDTSNQRIWLTPGQASNAYGLVGNISIAEDTIIERLYAGRGNDFLAGNHVGNLIAGGAGSDTIYGLGGNDTLMGQGGADLLIGGAGNDVYYVDAGDSIQEVAGGGNDTIRSAVSYSLDVHVENLQLLTGASNGYGNGTSNRVVGNAAGNILYGFSGNDTLRGESGNDTLIGGAGADSLIGGTGSDVLRGGVGDDYYVIRDTSDRIVEAAGEGRDVVQSTVSIRLADNVEDLYLQANAALAGYGNGAHNRLVGNAGANVLYGFSGNDTLSGQAGNDTLIGGSGNDWLVGGAGRDVLRGGAGNDYYVYDGQDQIIEEAGGGVDTVYTTGSMALMARVEHLVMNGTGPQHGYGNGGNNRITGNQANNLLSGGAGNDTLIGGGGADVFVFNAGRDIITDFRDDVDTLRIDDRHLGRTLTVSQALDLAEVVGGNTVFDFGNGHRLVLNGVTDIASLSDDLVIV